jgi:hypothetical protein
MLLPLIQVHSPDCACAGAEREPQMKTARKRAFAILCVQIPRCPNVFKYSSAKDGTCPELFNLYAPYPQVRLFCLRWSQAEEFDYRQQQRWDRARKSTEDTIGVPLKSAYRRLMSLTRSQRLDKKRVAATSRPFIPNLQIKCLKQQISAFDRSHGIAVWSHAQACRCGSSRLREHCACAARSEDHDRESPKRRLNLFRDSRG